jgi:hypothetical protein
MSRAISEGVLRLTQLKKIRRDGVGVQQKKSYYETGTHRQKQSQVQADLAYRNGMIIGFVSCTREPGGRRARVACREDVCSPHIGGCADR